MAKETISKREKRNRNIATAIVVLILLILALYIVKGNHKKINSTDKRVEKLKTREKSEKKVITSNDNIQLSVPLVNQNEEPSLYNGCEVSSLAMVLQYWGIDVTKNELADEIMTVPYEFDELMGDPNDGFVGSISGEDGPGYSVYSAPIVDLAKKKVTGNLSVKNLSGSSFDDILKEVLSGNPIWVITTTDFLAPTEFETWQTKNGAEKISWAVHSVVLTGFDSDFIYLNDPYGEQTKTDRESFLETWNKMGRQAMTIAPKY